MFPELSEFLFDEKGVAVLKFETDLGNYEITLCIITPTTPQGGAKPICKGSIVSRDGLEEHIEGGIASEGGIEQLYNELKAVLFQHETELEDGYDDDDDFGEGRQMAGMAYGNRGLADYDGLEDDDAWRGGRWGDNE